MLRLTDWTSTHRAKLNHIRKERLRRGIDPMAPVSFDTFTVPAGETRAFTRFVELVGGRGAETWLWRLYQYAAARSADTGEIRVPRAQFGRAVLSRGLDPVGRTLGERVYDALVESGLASTLGGATGAATGGTTKDALVVPPASVGGTTRPGPVVPRDGVGGTTRPPVVAPPVVPPEPAPGLASAHAEARAARATPTRRERAANARARTGEAGSSLNGTSGGTTGGATGGGPDLTAPERLVPTDPTTPATVEAPTPPTRSQRTANAAAVGGEGSGGLDPLPEQAIETEIATTFAACQRIAESGRWPKPTWEQVARAVRGLHALSERDARGAEVSRSLLFHAHHDRGPSWVRKTEDLLENEGVVSPPAPIVSPPAPAAVRPPAPAAPAGPVVASPWAKATQERLRGLISSAQAQELFERLTAISRSGTLLGATARAVVEADMPRRDVEWLARARDILVRAAAAPAEFEEDLFGELKSIQAAGYSAFALDADTLIRARGAPEPPADWEGSARDLISRWRESRAEATAGSLV